MITLSPHTLIRPEPDGALLFQQESAETALLDMEGLRALYRLLKGGRSDYPLFFARYLREHAFIIPGAPNGALQRVEQVLEGAPTTIAPPHSLAAPETIHFSVTPHCDQICPGCFYSARPGSEVTAAYVPFSLYRQVVEEAEAAGVFQFALGGGEPLLHPRLVEMARLARDHHIVPNLTTNGNRLTREMAEELKTAGLGQAQISLNGASEPANAATRPNFQAAIQAMENCRAVGLDFGINFLLTRSSAPDLEAVVALGRQLGAATVNLLRPKPPVLETDWLEQESLDAAGYRQVRRTLRRIQSDPSPRITIDASFTFLLTDKTPAQLAYAGVWGCSAARRFVTVLPDGAVLPCSHVRWSDVGDGAIMHAWRESKVFARFRALDETMRGRCAGCDFLSLCHGCPAVVMALGDEFGDSDPHCPR